MTMQTTSILITAANGDIAEAMARIIKSSYSDFTVDGADASGRLPGLLRFDNIFHLPWASDAGYIQALTRLVAERGYKLVIVASEPEALRLVNAGAEVSELPLLLNRANLITRFTDKIETSAWLRQIGLQAPQTWRADEVHKDFLPLFLKQRSGSGARVAMIVDDERLLSYAIDRAQREDLIFQELLDGRWDETTSAIIRAGGELRCISFRRRLVGGMTAWAEVIHEPALDHALQTLANNISDDDFFLNIQGKLTDKGPVFFEVNCRFSSTVMMRHQIGFKDLQWFLDWKLHGERPSAYKAPAMGTQIFRMAREEVVLP